MRISQLARSIAESPTLRLNEVAAILRERGEAVIHLGGGEPKTRAPLDALLSTSALLNSGDIKYTPPDGISSLKKAVIRYTEEHYGRMVAPENVIISGGAKQSLSVLLTTLINPQEEVVILSPYWVSYPEMVKLAYGVPVKVTPEDGSYHPRMADIEEVIGRYTRAVIVNSPANPSGVVFSSDFIGELVGLCERRGIYLIMDDIYNQLIFDGGKMVSAYEFTKRDVEQTMVIVINGVSKSYAMTGFRIGWTIAPRPIVEAMTNVQAQTTSCPSALLQAAAVGALTGIQSGVESLRTTLENNRDVMLAELKAFEGVKCVKPGGTFYCFPDFRAYSKDSVELANTLLDKARVVTVPGKEFGMDGHLRLSFCGSVKEIKEGIARIKWVLDPDSPREIYIGDRRYVRDWL